MTRIEKIFSLKFTDEQNTEVKQLRPPLMSIEEVVILIEELYSPNPSHDVNQIQQNLQAIQKSEHGFHIANELLARQSHSTNVKYFGALTLTVQLSYNGDSYETLWKLLKCNLIHLVKYCSLYVDDPQNYASVLTIIRKLMSNLSLIFTDINEKNSTTPVEDSITHWNNPINTLLLLLSQVNTFQPALMESPGIDQIVQKSIDATVTYDELLAAIQNSSACNKLILMFTEIIVEDLTKFQTKKNQMSRIYEVVHEHLYISTMVLINANLTLLHYTDEVLFKCIGAWINYISMARNVSKHGRMDLSDMFENMINCLCESTESSDRFANAESILTLFGSVFANDPTLMGYEQREKIEMIFIGVTRSGIPDTSKHEWMLGYMNYLVTNDLIEELKELAVCVIDFLQINTLDVCNKLFTSISLSTGNHQSLQQYVKVLLQLTNFPLIPVLQESFSVRMVDFWLDLSEAYTNLASESLTEYGPQLAIDIFQQVINAYLPKISLLHKQKIIQEGDDETSLHEFDDFRAAVSDLMESLWSILGNDKLTNVLITGVGKEPYSANGVTHVDIFEIEAMVYLLNTLLRDMTLSESPWICDIMDSCPNFVNNILMLLKTGYESEGGNYAGRILKLDFVRTSSSLIGTLAGYFQQSDSQLNECIETLFHGLESTTRDTGQNCRDVNEKLEVLTIKAISTLCDTCRRELKSSLMKLMNVLNTIMMPTSSVSSFTREKLVRSIGYIIESQQEGGPEEQAKYLLELISLFENLATQTMNTSDPQGYEPKSYLHCLLSCISELGSALIPREESEDVAYVQRLPDFKEYWSSDPLSIRFKVMNLIKHILSDPNLSGEPEFIEISCFIIGKALSLSEDEPHFLKYSMPEIMEFILEHVAKTNISASLPYYVYLLEKLINQFKEQLTPQDFDFIFERVFLSTYQQAILNDPDLLQSTINFVNSTLDCKPSLLIQSKQWMTFVLPEFLKLLSVREKFTIVAITKFWTKILNNRKYMQQDLASVQQQINSIGEELVSQTILGLYHTQRSDLSNFTDLLRALVSKFPMQTRTWLSTALPRVSDNHGAHERFIKKLFITRGNRAAANVILEWWLECNQLPAI